MERPKPKPIPKNQRLLKLRSGLEVWAQTLEEGPGQISVNLEIFPAVGAQDGQVQELISHLNELAQSQGWPAPVQKAKERPITLFLPAVPEDALELIQQKLAETEQ